MEISELLKGIDNNKHQLEQWQDWNGKLNAVFNDYSNSVDRALILGSWSKLPAFAFASGYQAALFNLYPQADIKHRYAFCVTESGGNGPKAIQSFIEQQDNGFYANGEKSFITAIDQADRFLVALELRVPNANTDDFSKKSFKLVLIDRDQHGVTLQQHPPLPFVSELAHGGMLLKDVRIQGNQVLPGDGYEDYVKPFRTIEDIHVSVAFVGFWLGVALTYNWPKALIEKLLGCWLAYRALVEFSSKDFGVHVALAGVLQQQFELDQQIAQLIEALPEQQKTLFQRDRQIQLVAQKARQMRLNKAWENIGLNLLNIENDGR